MNKKKVAVSFVVFLLLIAVGLFAERYYVNSNYVGKYFGLGNPVAREMNALEEAQQLVQNGDIQSAQQIYKTLIKESTDDVVYERSLREYGRGLARDDVSQSIQQIITLATNPRVRASARAGAVERLASAYLFSEFDIAPETLSELIFSNQVFRSVQERAAEETPEYVVLAEYGQSISPRPFSSAILAEYYARRLYEGQKSASSAFQSNVDQALKLIPDMANTNPYKAPALSSVATALLYGQSAGSVPVEDTSFADVFLEALKVSEDMSRTLTQLREQDSSVTWDETFINTQPFAPSAQFSSIFSAMNEVPYRKLAEEIVDAYITYIRDGGYVATSTQEQVARLAEKYPRLIIDN